MHIFWDSALIHVKPRKLINRQPASGQRAALRGDFKFSRGFTTILGLIHNNVSSSKCIFRPKKWGSIFHRKNTKPRGQRGFGKRPHFFRIFFCSLPLPQIFEFYIVTTFLSRCNSKYLNLTLLQRFSVVVTANIWIWHCYNVSQNCYNLFVLLHRLFDVTILLQRLDVVTILLHRIACNCYNVFAQGCNNGIFHCYACYNALLQALYQPEAESTDNNGWWGEWEGGGGLSH